MPKKYRLQLVQDLILTAILLSLFGYHLFEEEVHEWLGLSFLGLILSHTGLNLWWFKKLKQGQYNGYRWLQTGLNLVLITLFIVAVVSGILLSKYLFADFALHSTSDLMRKIHMLSTHWIQIVLAIHLGLHWKALTNMLANWLKLNEDKALSHTLSLLWIVLSLYGIWAFFFRELHAYLFNQVEFAYFDFEEPVFRFYCDYFAMLIAVAYGTRVTVWFCFFRRVK